MYGVCGIDECAIYTRLRLRLVRGSWRRRFEKPPAPFHITLSKKLTSIHQILIVYKIPKKSILSVRALWNMVAKAVKSISTKHQFYNYKPKEDIMRKKQKYSFMPSWYTFYLGQNCKSIVLEVSPAALSYLAEMLSVTSESVKLTKSMYDVGDFAAFGKTNSGFGKVFVTCASKQSGWTAWEINIPTLECSIGQADSTMEQEEKVIALCRYKNDVCATLHLFLNCLWLFKRDDPGDFKQLIVVKTFYSPPINSGSIGRMGNLEVLFTPEAISRLQKCRDDLDLAQDAMWQVYRRMWPSRKVSKRPFVALFGLSSRQITMRVFDIMCATDEFANISEGPSLLLPEFASSLRVVGLSFEQIICLFVGLAKINEFVTGGRVETFHSMQIVAPIVTPVEEVSCAVGWEG